MGPVNLRDAEQNLAEELGLHFKVTGDAGPVVGGRV